MFEAFLKFVGESTDDAITDNKAFFDKMQSKTFLNGMYRFFTNALDRQDVRKRIFEIPFHSVDSNTVIMQ